MSYARGEPVFNGKVEKVEARAERAAASIKVKCAGAATAGVMVSLAFAPEALARLAVNHNEILLAD